MFSNLFEIKYNRVSVAWCFYALEAWFRCVFMLGEYLSLLEIEYLAVSLVYVVSMLAWLAAIEIK
jgi:hypothetical protein